MIVSGPDGIRKAVVALHRGEVVGIPTETVYGLAADARSSDAVRRIFKTKGRPADRPMIVHIGKHEALSDLVDDVPDMAWALAKRFWPGPLTLILPSAGYVAREVTAGKSTVGVRMPSHRVALELLRAYGGPLAAPSANRYGSVSPTTASHVAEGLGTEVAMVLDGGPCEVGIESTIVDLSQDRPKVLRLGAITREQLAEVIGHDVPYAEAPGLNTPGSDVSHYKPDASVYVVSKSQIDAKLRDLTAEGRQVGLVLRERISGLNGAHHTQVVGDGTHAYAQKLYECLRFADGKGVDAVIVEPPANDGLGQAILDRLTRAATHVSC